MGKRCHSRFNAEADVGQQASTTECKQFDKLSKCRLTHAAELFRTACV